MTAAETINAALGRMTRKRRRVAAVGAGATGVAVAGAWLLAAALADRWLHTPAWSRAVTAAVAGVVVGVAVLRAAWLAFVRRFDALAAARVAEAADPAWDERLSTVVTQARLPAVRRGSATLNDALATNVADEIARRPPTRGVRLRDTRPAVMWALVVGLAWATAAGVPPLELPRLAARQWRPWSGGPPVTSTRIELAPHASDVEQGRSLSVVADLPAGDGPVTLHVGPDLAHSQSLEMRWLYGRRFAVTLLALQTDFVYRVTAGDAAAGPVAVRVLRTPGVTAIDLVLVYADGRPPLDRPGGDGRLRVPAGTRVGVTFRTTEAVRGAAVRVGEETIDARPDADRRTWRAVFVAKSDVAWSVTLTGDRGNRGSGPAGMRVSVER